MASDSTHLDTLLQHTGIADFDPVSGAAPVGLPPVRTSTVRFQNLDALENAERRKAAGERVVAYGRMGLDTHVALEDVFKHLEQGTHCYLAPSGLSAITLAFMALLSAGEHALVADNVYGPVHSLDQAVLRRLGIEISFFAPNYDDIDALVRPNTKLLYVESPGSLLFEMLDIPKLAEKARQHGLVLASDNTWGSGYVYKPLALGAQVSVVAGTKYVGGHSDLMLGAVVTNDAQLAQRINKTQYAMGYSVSADDAWLALRGVRTLPLRMAQHARNALRVCEFLAARPEVARLYHPALPSDAGHAIWRRDCTGSNGMMAAALRLAPAQARVFVDSLRLFSIGYSWGGFESLVQLVSLPTLAGHRYWQGDGQAVVRLHIGLEAPEDLIDDLAQALERASAASA